MKRNILHTAKPDLNVDEWYCELNILRNNIWDTEMNLSRHESPYVKGYELGKSK